VARARISDESALDFARFVLDGRRMRASRRTDLRLRVRAHRVRPGRHRVTVSARDAAGNRARTTRRFRRCRGR
jgi:hypothetical protein